MSEFWSAIAGAVVGSVVGGIISYCLQLSALNAAKNERAEVATEERQALGYGLLFKIVSIVNNLGNLKLHVDECKARAVADQHPGPPVTFLLPLINIPDPVNIGPAEMGMLLSLGNDDTFNDVMNIPQIHNGILPAWAVFAAMRATFNQAVSQTIDFSTGKGEFAFNPQGPDAVKFYEADQVAADLISRAERDFAEADLVLKNVMKLLKDKLGLKISAEAKLPIRSSGGI
ncbi:MAG: hypothetical protein E5Y10_25045 [Mesorhizobium sp.]|uniref:hypothetical protein n=1 Tax=Mesorhizobium sp. TaxID=1871066 RepID=UPI00121F99CB|nr:hypothetical protein [Mesorhizobium sp.]TIN38850.1 MAG: hypothetical protein E5Y13_15465 [Mesorhizobium sp.]TJU85690.1 MAG: hypothetical protein E5Y10_25045 [Mesorhizobium sp.]